MVEKMSPQKPSLLELAEELGHVSQACRIAGYNREQLCEIRGTRACPEARGS